MDWDKESWAADLIVKDGPLEFLQKLIPLDGTSENKPSRRRTSPSAMIGLGLVKGAPGAGMADAGEEWLSPLGQKVVDRLLRRV